MTPQELITPYLFRITGREAGINVLLPIAAEIAMKEYAKHEVANALLSLDQIKANLKPLEWEAGLFIWAGIRDVTKRKRRVLYRISKVDFEYVLLHGKRNKELQRYPTLELAQAAAFDHYAQKVAELFNLPTESL